MKNRAYTFAEILITLLIIATVAVLTSKVIPEKARKVKKEKTHGTYACTLFDGQSYVFEGGKKNAQIPSDKSKWKQKECGNGFILPNSGILEVKVIAGGGAGGTATVTTEQAMPETSVDDWSDIDADGWYDLTVYSGSGTESSLSKWYVTSQDAGGSAICNASDAYGGRGYMVSGQMYLSRGDKVTIQKSSGTAVNISMCGAYNKPAAFPGHSGDSYTIKVNGGSVLSVTGGAAGNYNCFPGNPCTNRFRPITSPSNGSYTIHNDSKFKLKSASTNAGVSARVNLGWSSKNGSSQVQKKKPGCGGMPGAINATLYPLLRNKLPEMKIGKGGTNGMDGGDTSFDTLTAQGGAANALCQPVGSEDNGTAGGNFTGLTGSVYSGGAGGTQSNINGANGSGFASGGGGGAIRGSSKGTGGEGKPGMIVFTW